MANIVINAFFSGTGFNISEDQKFLAASLYKEASDNSAAGSEVHNFGFSGCGVDFGIMGMLWGTGLDKQAETVIAQVEKEIKKGNKVTLNAYGHSRGGIAALLMAKQLGKINPDLLEINLALLDPVPGNYITTSSMDFLNISLANKAMDLSDCKPLKKVLALYPFKPLPDIACHAPLFPKYPNHTNVEEDAMPGCHAEAEHLRAEAGMITQKRVRMFLASCGTQLNDSYAENDNLEGITRSYMSALAGLPNNDHSAVKRCSHSSSGKIIEANRGHENFTQKYSTMSQFQIELFQKNPNRDFNQHIRIKRRPGMLLRLNKNMETSPLMVMAFKWAVISTAVTSALFFSGGLAAIPLFVAITAKLGLAASLALSTLTVGTAATLTAEHIVLPTLRWASEKFFYPYYKMREFEAEIEELESEKPVPPVNSMFWSTEPEQSDTSLEGRYTSNSRV